MTVDFSPLQQLGYLPVPKAVEAPLIAEFEATMADLGAALLARKGVKQRSPDAIADALRSGGDFRVRLFSNLKNLHVVNRMSECVARRLEADGFMERAKLTAPLLYPTLRADVPGEQTYLLPLHQDYATQCRKAWRIWIPLRDADEDAGTMCIVPGSHARGVLHHDVSDPLMPHVPQSELGSVAPLNLTMPAGDGVLFDPLLVHGSVPSRGNRMKYVLLVQIQDLATVADPDDPNDPLPARLAMAAARDRERAAALARGREVEASPQSTVPDSASDDNGKVGVPGRE